MTERKLALIEPFVDSAHRPENCEATEAMAIKELEDLGFDKYLRYRAYKVGAKAVKVSKYPRNLPQIYPVEEEMYVDANSDNLQAITKANSYMRQIVNLFEQSSPLERMQLAHEIPDQDLRTVYTRQFVEQDRIFLSDPDLENQAYELMSLLEQHQLIVPLQGLRVLVSDELPANIPFTPTPEDFSLVKRNLVVERAYIQRPQAYEGQLRDYKARFNDFIHNCCWIGLD